jgi:hypothetical protein
MSNFINILKIIFAIITFYFFTLGLGYGTTYLTIGTIYNMTTGHKFGIDKCLNLLDCIMCYNDQYVGFYGGCFLIGVVANFVLVSSILFMFALVCIWNYPMEPIF